MYIYHDNEIWPPNMMNRTHVVHKSYMLGMRLDECHHQTFDLYRYKVVLGFMVIKTANYPLVI